MALVLIEASCSIVIPLTNDAENAAIWFEVKALICNEDIACNCVLFKAAI